MKSIGQYVEYMDKITGIKWRFINTYTVCRSFLKEDLHTYTVCRSFLKEDLPTYIKILDDKRIKFFINPDEDGRYTSTIYIYIHDINNHVSLLREDKINSILDDN